MDILIVILTIFALVMIFGLLGKGVGSAIGGLLSHPSSMMKINLKNRKSKGGYAVVRYAYYDDEKKMGVAHVACPSINEEKSVFSGSIPCLETEVERLMEIYDRKCCETS